MNPQDGDVVKKGNGYSVYFGGRWVEGFGDPQQAVSWATDQARQANQNLAPGEHPVGDFANKIYNDDQHNALGQGIWDMINGPHNSGDLGADNGLLNKFRGGLGNVIDNPGMTTEQEQQMVNQQREGITQGENDAQMRASEMAGAMGFGESGDKMAGSREISQKYDAMGNAAERDTRLGVSKQRNEQEMQALGLGGSYLGAAQNRAADDSRWRASANLGLMHQGFMPGGAGGAGASGSGTGFEGYGTPSGGGASQQVGYHKQGGAMPGNGAPGINHTPSWNAGSMVGQPAIKGKKAVLPAKAPKSPYMANGYF